MIQNKTFRFDVSISNEVCEDKIICGALIGGGRLNRKKGQKFNDKVKENKTIRTQYGFSGPMTFTRVNVNVDELVNHLITGRTVCGCFNKGADFKPRDKKNINFDGANLVSIDIDDTNYPDAKTLLNYLSLQPTFFHTTWSNHKPGKGTRVRLGYVISTTIDNYVQFRYIAWLVCTRIMGDLNQYGQADFDKCSLNASQYYNGVNINSRTDNLVDFDYGMSYYIYDLHDLGYYDTSKRNEFIDNDGYWKTDLKKRKEDINLFFSGGRCKYYSEDYDWRYIEDYYTEGTRIDSNGKEWVNLIFTDADDYDKYWKYHCGKYPIFYRSCIPDETGGKFWTRDKLCVPKPDDYWEISRTRCKVGANDNRAREQWLWKRAMERRLMSPEVDHITLFHNLVWDREYTVDNSDGKITAWTLVGIVNNVMEDDSILEDRDNKIAEKIKEYADKKGPIWKNRKAYELGADGKVVLVENIVYSKPRLGSVLEAYDTTREEVQNELMRLYNISLETARTWFNAFKSIHPGNNVEPDDDWLKDNLINKDEPVRKNWERIKGLGFRVGRDKIEKLLKEKKSTPSQPPISPFHFSVPDFLNNKQ